MSGRGKPREEMTRSEKIADTKRRRKRQLEKEFEEGEPQKRQRLKEPELPPGHEVLPSPVATPSTSPSLATPMTPQQPQVTPQVAPIVIAPTVPSQVSLPDDFHTKTQQMMEAALGKHLEGMKQLLKPEAPVIKSFVGARQPLSAAEDETPNAGAFTSGSAPSGIVRGVPPPRVGKDKKAEKPRVGVDKKGKERGVPPPRGGVEEAVAPVPEEAKEAPAAIVKAPKKELPLMEFPSTTLVLGKKFSGKTTLLLNIINPSDFDNIFIISQTSHVGNLNVIEPNPKRHLTDVSDEFIDKLIKIHRANPDMRTLLLFDDFIGGKFNLKSSKKMGLLATSGRNFGISIIFSSQDLPSVPPLFRRNAEYVYLGHLLAKPIKAVAEEFSDASVSFEKLTELLREIATNMGHDWLFYDSRNSYWRLIQGSELENRLGKK